MPKLSIAMCGLSLLALITAAPALAASPLSGQNLTNSVGDITTNPGSVSNGVGGLPGTSQSGITDKLGGIPTDGSSIDTGSLQNSPGSLLPADELGGANAGVPLTNGVDPANWNLKKGLGETLVMTADIDLEKHGHPGGLAAQGVELQPDHRATRLRGRDAAGKCGDGPGRRRRPGDGLGLHQPARPGRTIGPISRTTVAPTPHRQRLVCGA